MLMILGVVISVEGVLGCTLVSYAYQSLVNMLIILMLWAGVSLWFLIKNKRYTPVMDRYLGRGDVIFWILAGLYFSPVVFIFFQIVTMMLGVILFSILQQFKSKKEKKGTIPLAGIQAFFLGLVEVMDVVNIFSFQYRDDLVLELLY